MTKQTTFPGGAVAVTSTQYVVQFNPFDKGVWQDVIEPQDTAQDAFQTMDAYLDGATAPMRAKYRVIERVSTVTESVVEA